MYKSIISALLDIILRHRQAKIFVGDPHQQIYSFRGAVNSMSRITDTKTFYLTQVCRIPPIIFNMRKTKLNMRL